ncbi:MAG: DUF721 domain-containing protein [Planctomycetes bacterium]|nr:DUF721 domain-containing protein [Planctomycetota bacterium]
MAKTPRPTALGDILKQVVRKEGLGKHKLEGRRLARKALHDKLGPELSPHADVASVRTGVVTVEVDSAALFQELEGFHREELAAAFREAGLKVREVRVKLAAK